MLDAKEEDTLDVYLEEEKKPQMPQDNMPKKYTNTILLSAILMVAVMILILQIWQPFSNDNTSNTMTKDDGKIFHQQGSSDEETNTQAFGNSEGPETSGQFIDENGDEICFRSKNGSTEYSYDGGNTWTTTPPQGDIPIP